MIKEEQNEDDLYMGSMEESKQASKKKEKGFFGKLGDNISAALF